MSLKPGTLVKYRPHAANYLQRGGGAVHCYWNLNWSWDKIEAKLIGIVLKNLENGRVQVRWFGINKTFNWEHEEYLECVKEI